MSISEEMIHELLESYYLNTHIYCAAFDLAGKIYSRKGCFNRSAFCNFIHWFDYQNSCKQSCIYGALQAKTKNEPYIYFCPYGLVNSTVPVYLDGIDIYLTGGPVLIHGVDDILTSGIIAQNQLLKSRYHNVRARLNEVKVVDFANVVQYSDMLAKMAGELQLKKDHKAGENCRTKGAYFFVPDFDEGINKDAFMMKMESSQLEMQMEELISEIEKGDQQGVNRILNNFLDVLSSCISFEAVKLKALSLVMSSIVLLGQLDDQFKERFKYFFMVDHIVISIFATSDISELSDKLVRIFGNTLSCFSCEGNVKNKDLLYRALNYIRNNYSTVCLDDVSAEIGLNPSYFSKIFKDGLGVNYCQYVNKIRIEQSKKLLREGLPLSEIAQMVGFNDQSYFTRVFRKYEGVSPYKWQNDI